MEGDPRVSKPRLPKVYTEEQLHFLKSHISGFETRTRGHVRGDAKKFALDRASEFLVQFGLPPELQGVDEAEPRFREQIYNWYKNTVGRARRKLEGRTRGKKSSDKGSISWTPTIATFGSPSDTPDPGSNSHTHTPQQQPPQPQQEQPQPGPSGKQLQFTFPAAVPVPVRVPSPSPITLSVTPSALRDAFATHAIDVHTLSSLIQSYVLAHPSPTPLMPVIHALFDAASSILSSASAVPGASVAPASTSGAAATAGVTYAQTDVLCTLLRRFVDACAFFPSTLVHADVSGPLAGSRALQTALRKSSVWTSTSGGGNGHVGGSGSGSAQGSLSDEMERIKVDRQRRKDHVQWAQMHAAAIELGIVGVANSVASPKAATNIPASMNVGVGVVGTNANTGYHHQPGQGQLGYAPSSSETLSEMMVRDAVWEQDEVEWVAGIIVLRALIRAGGTGRRVEWERLLVAYERRWKEIKDEARQALVTEVLLGARDDLARLDESRVT